MAADRTYLDGFGRRVSVHDIFSLPRVGGRLDGNVWSFAAGRDPCLRNSQRAVGICLLVRRTLHRGIFRVRCVFLNTSGENEDEEPVLEFNNLLCLTGWERAVATALTSYIKMESWDEIWLDGFCQGPPLDALAEACSGLLRKRSVRAAFWVDLKRVREHPGSYEAVLGSKDRARLRQNFRSYGETETIVPQDSDNALKIFQDLADLHTKTWQTRNQLALSLRPFFAPFITISSAAASRIKGSNLCEFKPQRGQ